MSLSISPSPRPTFLRIGALILTCVLCAARAEAHNLILDHKILPDKVTLEAYYDDDTPCRDAKIQVERPDKTLVVLGRTDKDGRWEFPLLDPGKYLAIVNDGAGHSARSKFQIADTATKDIAVSIPETIEPSRAEKTRFPWRNLGIGLIVIGVAAFGLRLVLRHTHSAS
jgi:hypothetical protein